MTIVKPSTPNERLDARIGIEWQKVRRHLRHDRDDVPGEQRARESGDDAYEQTFENEEPHDTATRRADRHAQRDFAPASAEPNQQEIRNIAARDEQHERDGRE